ncbi:MAG: LysR family transcriptional regulator [bacterium]
MSFLNYHHLRYFRAIANEGSLTRAASKLGISQSAISIQLRKLEESLGDALFSRDHKTLVLTEAGRLVLDYAESIFKTGEELMDCLRNKTVDARQIVRIGAVSTMSRNFQLQFLQPLFHRDDVELVLRSGGLNDLLTQLETHTLDLILSNLPVKRDSQTGWHCQLLDEQPVSLVGKKSKGSKKFRFPEDLLSTPLILPSLESNIRAGFDLLMEQAGVRPIIAAEVDDMAMLRLLATTADALTLVPPIVVRDELKKGLLVEKHRFPQIKKNFYAITPRRRFPNSIVQELIRKMM